MGRANVGVGEALLAVGGPGISWAGWARAGAAASETCGLGTCLSVARWGSWVSAGRAS